VIPGDKETFYCIQSSSTQLSELILPFTSRENTTSNREDSFFLLWMSFSGHRHLREMNIKRSQRGLEEWGLMWTVY
jgi:hypothetical protein